MYSAPHFRGGQRRPSALSLGMASTTRWLSPLASRPADYPRDLPFLSERSCMLSRSGAGESELFSVIQEGLPEREAA